MKEDYHDVRGAWLTDRIVQYAQEVRHAVRMLAKSPAFTFVAALSLALGIGANSALFSLHDAILLRPLPVREPDSLLAPSPQPELMAAGSAAVYRTNQQQHVVYELRDLPDKAGPFEGLIADRIGAR